jgi:hypothetical protein
LFDGKRFDLGLYEAGSSNSVQFDRAGVSFLFCNIHPEMSAVVVSVPSSLFTTTNSSGQWAIHLVRPGRYRLHVWYERSSPEDLAKLQRDVVISTSNQTVETIRLTGSATANSSHKNKYGKDYVPAAGSPYSIP